MKGSKPSALTAARTGVALVWFSALIAVALAVDHPLILGSLIGSLLLIGALTGSLPILLRTLAFSVPLALTVMLVNLLVSHDGVTVIARLGEVPVLGRLDLTLEALVQSCVLAMRVIVIGLSVAVFAACVDQDEIVAILRRRSGRFGIVTALAARLVPLLAADGRRMADARKAMPSAVAPSRVAVFNSLASGALDRAADAAATLELRGLGDGPCLAPRASRAWSRHDVALSAAAAVLVIATAAAMLAGVIACQLGDRIELAVGPGTFAFALMLPILAALPLLDRRGVGR